jgi:hypothetical protein
MSAIRNKSEFGDYFKRKTENDGKRRKKRHAGNQRHQVQTDAEGFRMRKWQQVLPDRLSRLKEEITF